MDSPVPQVSVCLLTCNHVRYIRRSIESVLAQAHDVSVEVLIGDDCSDDGTSEIVAEFAAAHPRLIMQIRHDRRIGGSANYLAMLRRLRAPFIAHLDGDDYWAPGKLKRQLDYLHAHPDCAAVYANALTINERGDPIGLFNDATRIRFELADLLRRGNFLNNSSMMFRSSLRQAILEIKGPVLDFRIHLQHARTGYLAQLPESLVTYRVNSTGSVVAQLNDLVREAYWDAILSVPRELVSDDDFAHGIADFLRRVAFRTLRTRRWELVRKWAPRVFTASPYGTTRTAYLVAASIFRIAMKEVIGRFRHGSDGRRVAVLYRR